MPQEPIKASPTKEFFIDMLTKDIKLERAIIDLIDNSIDGARKLRDMNSFNGLWIKIEISPDKFEIEDNCGGFNLETAQKYAFMFGRPAGSSHDVKHSVGRFGVGMKRALFKLGNCFEVESKCEQDHFQVSVDVSQWSSTMDWVFQYSNITEETKNLNVDDGTYIKVTSLSKDVISEFSSQIFISSLKGEIERTLSFSINNGLEIYLNDILLKNNKLTFLESHILKPFYKSLNVEGVLIKIYAGISKPSPDEAGWYIYCNERLVLEKDKTNLTGWEGRRFGESNVQKFHHIYAMFRGVVFFSADDPKLLPMTTTKTGVDSNSTTFKAARLEMIKAMTQVISFLKDIDSDEQRNDIITASEEIDVIQLYQKVYTHRFVYPTIQRAGDIDDLYTSISFRAEKEKVNKGKEFFSVTTNKEVGEKVFEYFLKREGENI